MTEGQRKNKLAELGRRSFAAPELLAPAGNLEKLVFAEKYGADAVYFGLKQFSLRSFAGNFTLDEAEEGLRHLHGQGKKGYCALNIYPFQDEYDQLMSAAGAVEEMGVDGFIVSDIGVMTEMKARGIRTPLHVSTQANTVSPQAVAALVRLGASRVNIARELSIERIRALVSATSQLPVEIEMFVHGSLCFSYSGRCAISDYLTGRQANRGQCTHPCRWQYRVVEEKRPGEYLPIFEDDRGTYLFNSRDLALFEFVPGLAAAGVASFKLEGRMKSIHYVAQVVSLYRRILDGEAVTRASALQCLGRVKNRGYTTGFQKGEIGPDDYKYDKSVPSSRAVFLGSIEDAAASGMAVISIRNRIVAGEQVEVLKTDGTVVEMVLPEPLIDTEGGRHAHASHGTRVVLSEKLPPFSIIRRPVTVDMSQN